MPNCAEGGVIGVLPGIVGSLQANEVIKVISGVGEPLSGRLFLFDAASFTTRTLKVNKNLLFKRIKEKSSSRREIDPCERGIWACIFVSSLNNEVELE